MNIDSTPLTPEPPAPAWVTPEVTCYETRPEVTAYAGDGGPWINR